MELRRRFAVEFDQARTFGTWCAGGVLGLAFGLQIWMLQPSDPLGMLRLGANAPVLFWHGEWFRLITANLLHATPRHALGDAVCLVMIGTVIERLIGLQRTILVLMATAMVAQAASGVTTGVPTRQLFFVGLSGGLCGLLSALAVVKCWFRATLPSGLRSGEIAWWISMVLGAGIIPVALQWVDIVAPAVGAAAGIALGLLLCRGCADITDFRHPQALTSAAFATIMLVWGGAVAAAIWHTSDPTAMNVDRARLMTGMLSGSRSFPPDQQNLVAWDVAVDVRVSPALLEQASELAARAVATAMRANSGSVATAAYIDTRAALDFRRGDAVQAMRREFPLIGRGEPFTAHFTQFLDRVLRQDGLQVIGEVGPAAPSVALGSGVLRLATNEAAPAGARVYAVLRGVGA